jgi:hypothetical protein
MDLDSNEFYLSHGSGDEYFEVLNDEGETIREGEIVQVSRGDSVRVSLNALHMSAREYAEHGKLYAWCGVVKVDEDGHLVLPTGKRCQADGSQIEIRPQNGNCLRFGRTEDCTDLEALLNREHERPWAGQRSPANGVEFGPDVKQSAGMASATNDLLAAIRRRWSQGQIPRETEQSACRRPTRAISVRWLSAEFNPTARISDDIRATIAAMPPEQRGEFVVEGDDWIELHASNGHRAEGRAVLANRGDRLTIHFGTWCVLAAINTQGQLDLWGGGRRDARAG